LEELVNQYYAQLELIDHPLEVLLCLIVWNVTLVSSAPAMALLYQMNAHQAQIVL
jgi:hypothetical protein